jgi:hypothetical protein
MHGGHLNNGISKLDHGADFIKFVQSRRNSLNLDIK